MSGVPPQQPPVCTCNECSQQKKTATREVTYSSTTEDSETKHRQGTTNLGSISGELDRKDSETTINSRQVRKEENFFICPTPGCPQRASDRWDARRWELKNDPALDDSPENQDREIDRILNEERKHREQKKRISNETHTKDSDTTKKDGIRHREQEKQRYRDGKNKTETESSRQSARNSTRQSSRQSCDNGSRSQQSDEQTTVDGWGAADSTQSDQQTTANGWRTTDADRASNQSRTNRDAFRGDVDARTNTTQTGNDVFADNVYDEETAADDKTVSKRDAFQDATDPEALDDDTTETHNRSWSQSRNR